MQQGLWAGGEEGQRQGDAQVGRSEQAAPLPGLPGGEGALIGGQVWGGSDGHVCLCGWPPCGLKEAGQGQGWGGAAQGAHQGREGGGGGEEGWGQGLQGLKQGPQLGSCLWVPQGGSAAPHGSQQGLLGAQGALWQGGKQGQQGGGAWGASSTCPCTASLCAVPPAPALCPCQCLLHTNIEAGIWGAGLCLSLPDWAEACWVKGGAHYAHPHQVLLAALILEAELHAPPWQKVLQGQAAPPAPGAGGRLLAIGSQHHQVPVGSKGGEGGALGRGWPPWGPKVRPQPVHQQGLGGPWHGLEHRVVHGGVNASCCAKVPHKAQHGHVGGPQHKAHSLAVVGPGSAGVTEEAPRGRLKGLRQQGPPSAAAGGSSIGSQGCARALVAGAGQQGSCSSLQHSSAEGGGIGPGGQHCLQGGSLCRHCRGHAAHSSIPSGSEGCQSEVHNGPVTRAGAPGGVHCSQVGAHELSAGLQNGPAGGQVCSVSRGGAAAAAAAASATCCRPRQVPGRASQLQHCQWWRPPPRGAGQGQLLMRHPLHQPLHCAQLAAVKAALQGCSDGEEALALAQAGEQQLQHTGWPPARAAALCSQGSQGWGQGQGEGQVRGSLHSAPTEQVTAAQLAWGIEGSQQLKARPGGCRGGSGQPGIPWGQRQGRGRWLHPPLCQPTQHQPMALRAGQQQGAHALQQPPQGASCCRAQVPPQGSLGSSPRSLAQRQQAHVGVAVAEGEGGGGGQGGLRSQGPPHCAQAGSALRQQQALALPPPPPPHTPRNVARHCQHALGGAGASALGGDPVPQPPSSLCSHNGRGGGVPSKPGKEDLVQLPGAIAVLGLAGERVVVEPQAGVTQQGSWHASGSHCAAVGALALPIPAAGALSVVLCTPASVAQGSAEGVPAPLALQQQHDAVPRGLASPATAQQQRPMGWQGSQGSRHSAAVLCHWQRAQAGGL